MSDNFFKVSLLKVSENDLKELTAKFGSDNMIFFQLPKCATCNDSGYVQRYVTREEPLGPPVVVTERERCPICNEEPFKLTSE